MSKYYSTPFGYLESWSDVTVQCRADEDDNQPEKYARVIFKHCVTRATVTFQCAERCMLRFEI